MNWEMLPTFSLSQSYVAFSNVMCKVGLLRFILRLEASGWFKVCGHTWVFVDIQPPWLRFMKFVVFKRIVMKGNRLTAFFKLYFIF